MEGLLKKLGQDIKKEWTHRKQPAKTKTPAAPDAGMLEIVPEQHLEQRMLELMRGMFSEDQVLAPMDGTIHLVTGFPNQKGIFYDSGFGLVFTFPANADQDVVVKVTKDQPVTKGTPLFQVNRALLPKMTLDIINPAKLPGFEDVEENILRIA